MMVIALFLIAVFDGLAVESRMALEDTPSGDELVGALVAARAVALEHNPVPLPAPPDPTPGIAAGAQTPHTRIVAADDGRVGAQSLSPGVTSPAS
jgi:hypothetical protein